ncbi:MAG TPA: BTAD domain-containing putative transcriptional regulator [Streptosporangiaceae bacterium]|nr:BTAD domain-containing putative transcriptional regulator [Streptosporangiaceae bacterium]
MISRARALLTGLTALAVIGALVVGLPVVLYRFGGSPLPSHIASWHHIAAVLTSTDDGAVLLAVVRDCSWLAWLLFTIALIAETQAALRGRAAPRLWLGGMQGGAARLVALAALTFAAPPALTLTASAATAAQVHVGEAPRPAHPAMADLAQRSADPSGPSSARPSSASTAVVTLLDATTAEHVVTVRPGDCLWTIAQHYLGAGDLYPEIANMNYGRDMGDGQVFTNPSLIMPGWQLLVPESATSAGPSPAADPASANTAQASTGPASTGHTHHLGHPSSDPHYRRRHASASDRLPAASATESASRSAADSGSASGQQAADSYQTSADVAGRGGDQLPEVAVFGAGALAGAVLTSLARLRWRQRQHRRRGRRIALPADDRALAAERKLRAVAAADPPSTLPDALSCLEAGILGAGQVLPDIVGLHVTPGLLEVLLAAPALDAPPPPYAISPGRQGMCWQLELPAADDPVFPGSLGAPGSPGSGLLPGLFTVGSTDAGYLLLDLESLKVTGCDGPGALIDRVVTAAATELATGQWSGWYDLILVGFDDLATLGRAEHCASLDEAISLLDERSMAVSSRLADCPPADVRQLRLTAPDDEDWGLTILVSRLEPAPDELARLLELAEDGPGGIAALVAGDPEAPDGRMAPTVLQLAPDPRHQGEILANVIPLQIMVRPRSLSEAEYEAITTLFAVAAGLQDVSPDQVPYAVYGAPPWIPQAASMVAEPDTAYPAWGEDGEEAGYEPADGAHDEDDDPANPAWHQLGMPAGLPATFAGTPANGATAAFASPAAGFAPLSATPPDGVPAPPWVGLATSAGQATSAAARTQIRRLEIRILGPFVITGAVEQLQPKQAELVLALALAAPGGLTNSALCSMLGADPDHPKPSDAIRQIITRTRRRLGRASDGREYIIHAGNGNYLLHPDAWLDWTEFRALITSTSSAEDMRAGLALVRGEPFAGSYYWWIDIPLIETVRAEVVDAALTLGEFELATGVPRAAARAARAGLAAEISAEQLWRLLMRAEHAAGNSAGVAEAWRHCLDAIEDVAPGGEPHPETEALYRQLTSPARQHAPVRG